ncbi:hypothetical protein OG216_19645 [Streptomycetaceae bacterium NBC_01309]
MSNEQEEAGRRSGCPPHEFGNALAWRWSREMPTILKQGFLTTLYAMRAMASASGQLRFSGDGKPIRIQDIAKAAGCREKDVRRFLDAAILAGVVATVGERRRGKSTLYMLLLSPWPDWQAAAEHVKATARPRKAEGERSGHCGPNSDEASSGHGGPNSEDEVRATVARTEDDTVRATAARMGSGHSGPNGSGHSGPNNPGSTQELHQDQVGFISQPQKRAPRRDDGNPSRQQEMTPTEAASSEDTARRCRCGTVLVRAHRDRCVACLRDDEAKAAQNAQKPVQGTFLLPLAGGGQNIPGSRRERVQWPAEDPTAPERLCGCGRGHRLSDSDRCPGCVVAAEEYRLSREAVSNA